MADIIPDEQLFLLTAAQAAAILGVDVKTLRDSGVPYVIIRTHRRYTRALIAGWIERTAKWETDQSGSGKRAGGKRPARSISRKGAARLTGKSRSGSTVIEFERVAGLRID